MPQTLHAFLDVGTPIPGPAGPPGAPGEPTNILAPVPTEGDLPPEGERGDAVLTEDSGDLWSWNTPESTGTVPRPGTTADEFQWINVGHVVGPQGPSGFSSSAFDYMFSTTVATPPGGGQIRLNNADQTQATNLWINSVTSPGNDAGILLRGIASGDTLIVQDKDDGTRWQEYLVNDAVVDYGSWVEVPAEWKTGGSDLQPQRVYLIIRSAGTPGPPGPQGATGATGPKGDKGDPGDPASQTPWTQNVDADGHDLQDLNELDFRNTSGSNGFTYIASDHNQMYAGSQNNGLMWHVTSNTKAATFYGPVTTEGGPVEAKTTGFKFPDGTTQSTALTKAQAQTPWVQNVDAAGYTLSALKQLTVTGSNVAGADAAAGVTLNRGYDAVGDSMDLVWGPGPNRLGRLSMTLWGGGESAFVFHAQTAGGDGGNNEVLRVQGNKRILATAEVDIKGWGDGEGGDLRLCDVDGTPNWAVDVDSGNMLRIHRLGTLVLRISPSFVIQMLLGGSLKTLGVDGSGFVKAT